jgi:hypothetical protein
LTPRGPTKIDILTIFKHAVVISFFMFVMMLPVDFVDTVSQARIAPHQGRALAGSIHWPPFSGLNPA